MLATLALVFLALTLPPQDAEPTLGTFSRDAVLLIRDGRDLEGNAELTVDHAGYRYLFSSAETRDEFRRDPAVYEIQLGGACGRMGALSGRGRTDIYTVYRKRLYIFASEACRKGFLLAPAKVLEPVEEPARLTTPDEMKRGREVLERVVAWMGGADKVDTAVLRVRRERNVQSQAATHRSASSLLIAPDGRMRETSAWNDEKWVKVLAADDAFFVDPPDAVRVMQPVQRRSLERRHLLEPLALVQSRNRPGFLVACASWRTEMLSPDMPDASGETATLRIRCAGMNHRLTVAPKTGEVLSHRFLGWGPRMSLGKIERTYTRWASPSGVRIPVAWTTTFDGKAIKPTDRGTEDCVVEILEKAPADAFARPK